MLPGFGVQHPPDRYPHYHHHVRHQLLTVPHPALHWLLLSGYQHIAVVISILRVTDSIGYLLWVNIILAHLIATIVTCAHQAGLHLLAGGEGSQGEDDQQEDDRNNHAVSCVIKLKLN